MVKISIIDIYLEVNYLLLPFWDERSDGRLGRKDLLLLDVCTVPILYFIFQVTADNLFL